MSVDVASGKHIPKNETLFEFDDEVISIFENMSRRSIVGYDQAYRMIGHFASRYAWPKTGAEVWDFGTTTGKALAVIREGARLQPYIDYKAVDISEASVKHVAQRYPFADVRIHDLRDGLFPEDSQPKLPIHMAVFGYTLQFIEDTAVRMRLIHDLFDWMAPGGMVFVMEKYRYESPIVQEVAQDSYIQFRRDNGYTLEEITKKSTALANAMWPNTPEFMTRCLLEAGFKEVHTLYRELNFGGLLAIK